MRHEYLIITNVERLGGRDFLVAALFYQGNQIDYLLRPFNCYGFVIPLLEETLLNYEKEQVIRVWELHTGDPEIYLRAVQVPGIFPQLKHFSDVSITKALISTDREILAEFYDLELTPKEGRTEKTAKWKYWLIGILERVTKKLKGVS